MSTLDNIFSAAQSLTSAERAEFIGFLWDHTAPEDWIAPKQAWLDEANARSDAIDAGEMNCAPWSEARERARREAGLR